MVTCSFCKENYEIPRGMTVVQKDASVKHYCSSKCRKNAEMGRISKKVKWVKKSKTNKANKSKKEVFNEAKQEAKKVEEEVKTAKKKKA